MNYNLYTLIVVCVVNVMIRVWFMYSKFQVLSPISTLFCFVGYAYPYKNIFSLVDELGIKPFTNWTKSAQYSEDGLEVS